MDIDEVNEYFRQKENEARGTAEYWQHSGGLIPDSPTNQMQTGGTIQNNKEYTLDDIDTLPYFSPKQKEGFKNFLVKHQRQQQQQQHEQEQRLNFNPRDIT